MSLLAIAAATPFAPALAASTAVGIVGEVRGQWLDLTHGLDLHEGDPVFADSAVAPQAPYDASFVITIVLLSGQIRAMDCRISSCTTPLSFEQANTRPGFWRRLWRTLRQFLGERGQSVDVLASG